ncbi:MAG: DEAD/DEAH box helicase family protein [Candidatus Dojkabacteria bacterium]|nr:DEAD/DEAH box helicase family protein [Candidatus Dojkabacteria bacterium]
MNKFKLNSSYKPSGDQPKAIELLTLGVESGIKHQTLVGATGTGKTFTMANIINNLNRPTIVISHNKTLAAQLYSEFKNFFPDNAVEYFVSYYDYYQPEAYVPQKDLYIEKDADINEVIERYRNSATAALLTRKDVLIVATVSCIYGLGNPEEYTALSLSLKVGSNDVSRDQLFIRLRDMLYERTNTDFSIGTFRVRGDIVDVYLPLSDDVALRIEFFDNYIESLKTINPLTGELISKVNSFTIFPAKQYASTSESIKRAISMIFNDLEVEVKDFEKQGKMFEAARLRQRVNYDMEILQETGYCKGIENYSRYLENRPVGSPPSTLLDYFPSNYLMFIDESHITIPQVRAMFNGDLSRKKNLVEFGFRMRSAFDNRPLKFEEFLMRQNQTIYVSATPSEWELKMSMNSAKDVLDKLY